MIFLHILWIVQVIFVHDCPLFIEQIPWILPTKIPKPQDAAEALALKEAQQEAERAATARAQQAAEVRGEGF